MYSLPGALGPCHSTPEHPLSKLLVGALLFARPLSHCLPPRHSVQVLSSSAQSPRKSAFSLAVCANDVGRGLWGCSDKESYPVPIMAGPGQFAVFLCCWSNVMILLRFLSYRKSGNSWEGCYRIFTVLRESSALTMGPLRTQPRAGQ